MDDLISRQAALDAVFNNAEHPDKAYGAIRHLPSAQPEKRTEERTETHACDLISRQAVIEAINKIFPADPMRDDYTQGITCGAALANIYVAQLPSAQPEPCENTISRQAAIDALVGITMFKTKHEIMQRVNASVQDEQGWLGAVAECLDEIEDLPSAQPERPKGQWTYICNSDVNGLKIVECSKCHKRAYGSGNYCHNCGAEMVKGWE